MRRLSARIGLLASSLFVVFFLSLLAGVFTACQPAPVSEQPSRIWPTPAPYATSTPEALPARPATLSVTPTATPQTYTVQSGDTLISIAARFGLTLDALMAANPTVSPSFLQPGDVLEIPIAGDTLAMPLPPNTLQVSQAQCYPASGPDTGHTICLALVENLGDEPVEDVSVRLVLRREDGTQTEAQSFALLDAIFPGTRAPIMFSVQGSYDENAPIQAQIVTALPFDPASGRYAAGRIQQLSGHGNGRSLSVDGTIVPPPAGEWKSVRVALTAFDAQGRLVGVRAAGLNFTGDAPLAFHDVLFSQAGDIASFTAQVVWAADACNFCP